MLIDDEVNYLMAFGIGKFKHVVLLKGAHSV